MEDFRDALKPQFDEEKLASGYVESRRIERSILSNLYDILDLSLKGEQSQSLNYNTDLLERNLQRLFNDWQFFYDGEQGLNSGRCGEAFTRLVGSRILEDMPEVCDIPEDTKDLGVFIQKPKSENDKGFVEIVTTVGRSSQERTGCRFRFGASISDIDDRIKTITNEIDNKK